MRTPRLLSNNASDVHSFTPLLQERALGAAAKSLGADTIANTARTILHMRPKKSSQIQRLLAETLQQVAVSLFHTLGVVQRVTYKRGGATGYLFTFVAMNVNTSPTLAELRVSDFFPG